jgi:hypothetical protein
MKASLIFVILLVAFSNAILSQTYPVYGNETPVTINGLSFDAMEPALSTDGNALFFNSLNDAITTSLYYAAKVNDSTFNLIGLVPIVNQTVTPRLDAVASLDSANNFYWVSLRDYPAQYENLHRIKFTGAGYTNFGKVYGDFYINSPGYLIMDATTNYDGNQLIYCNAYFNSCIGVPCKASMGIAQKINDSTFNKLSNTSFLMANINDTSNYLVYAPNITKDGLELYYSRLLKTGTQTEILVSVRTNTSNAFSLPQVLVTSPSVFPEAPTLTTDKTKMYYHKKIGTQYKIFYQKRLSATGIDENQNSQTLNIYPNPAISNITIETQNLENPYSIDLYSTLGELMLSCSNKKTIDISQLENGIYILKFKQGQQEFTKKIIKY